MCVDDVTPGSTADILGLRRDDIIIGFKNSEANVEHTIHNSIQLEDAITHSRVGESISLHLIRQGNLFWTEDALLQQRD